MGDIFYDISASFSKALPDFVQEQYDGDCSRFLSLVDEHWKNAELPSMLTFVDKYLQYTCGENCQPSIELLDVLIPISRKLWFISTYNIITNNNSLKCNNMYNNYQNVYVKSPSNVDNNSNDVHNILEMYSIQDLELIDVVKKCRKMSLKLRIRACKLLNSILECCVQLVPAIWERGCKERCEYFCKALDFIKVEIILSAFERYFSPDYAYRMAVSYNKRKGWIGCIVRLSSLIRRVWLYRTDIGSLIVSYLAKFDYHQHYDLELCTLKQLNDCRKNDEHGNCLIFYKFRIVLLLCPNSTMYDLLIDGTLFKWWDLVDGTVVSSWHPMFFTFFFRAVKFAWASNKSVCSLFHDRIPSIFQLLLNSFELPNKNKMIRYKETMPGEYTCLLSKTLKLHKKIAKLLILLMHNTNSECNNIMGSTEKVVLDGLDLELNDKIISLDDVSEVFTNTSKGCNEVLVNNLKCLIKILFPFAHPSNSGKFSNNISLFLKYFTVSYSRLVLRLNYLNSHNPDFKVDAKVIDEMCEGMYRISLLGVFNKNIKICTNYEIIIRNICYINKSGYLLKVVNFFLQNLDDNTGVLQHNKIIASTRVLIQLIPLIVKYLPNLILNIFHLLFNYITLSEPFITIQNLIFISCTLEYLLHQTNRACCNDQEGLINKVNRFGLKIQDYCHVEEGSEMDELQQLIESILRLDFENKESNDTFSELYTDVVNNLNDFIILFLSKVLEMLVNINEVNFKNLSLMNNVDITLFLLIKSTLFNLFQLADPSLISTITNKLYDFIQTYSYKLNVIKYITSILSSLSYTKSSSLMTKYMLDLLLQELPKSDSDEKSVDEKRVNYLIQCLTSLVRYKFDLNHLDNLLKVVDWGLKVKDRKLYKLVVKLVYRVNQSIYNVYLLDYHSNTGIEVYTSIGQRVVWYVPTMKEYSVYTKLIKLLLNTINNKLGDISSTRGYDVDLEVNKILVTCKYLVKSILLLNIPMDAQNCEMTEDKLTESLVGTEYYKSILSCLQDSPGDNYKLRYFMELYLTSVGLYLYNYINSQEALYGLLEKLTKFLDFLLSKDYFSPHLLPNNYEFLSSSIKLSNNISITCTKFMIKYISFHFGVTKNSYLQDLNTAAYYSIVQDYYNTLLNFKKVNINSQLVQSLVSNNSDVEGDGVNEKVLNKLIMVSIDIICKNRYKNVASNCISILKNMILLYNNPKFNNLKHFIINSTLHTLLSRSANDCEFKSLCVDRDLFVSKNSDLYMNILGLFDTNILNYITLNQKLLTLFLTFVINVININNDLLINSYDLLYLQFLNLRETLKHSNTKEDVHRMLMFISENGVTPTNWKSNFYFVSLLLVYHRYIVDDYFFFSYVINLLEQHVNNGFILTLILQYILVTLININNNKVENLEILQKLAEPRVIECIYMSLIYCNHNIENAAETTNSNNNNSIIMNLIKFDKSWPRNRIPNNSTLVSKYNYYLSYHYLVFLLDKDERNGEMRDESLKVIFNVLQEILNLSKDYIEHHLSIIEIVGGLLKYFTNDLQASQDYFWNQTYQFLHQHLNVVKLDYIIHYMDVMRLILSTSTHYTSNAAGFTNLIKLLINFTVNPVEYNYTNLLLLQDDFDSFRNSVIPGNMLVMKQLKLFQVLLQEFNNAKWLLDPDLMQKLVLELLKNINNKSLKIRNEVNVILSYIINVVDNSALNEVIFSYIKQKALEISDVKEDEGLIMGLLNFTQPYYNSSLYKMNNTISFDLTKMLLHLVNSSNPTINTLTYECLSTIVRYFPDYFLPRALIHLFSWSVKNSSKKVISLLLTIYNDNVFIIQFNPVMQLFLYINLNTLNHKLLLDHLINNLINITSTLDDEVVVKLLDKLEIDSHNQRDNPVVDEMKFNVVSSIINSSKFNIPNYLPNLFSHLIKNFYSKDNVKRRMKIEATIQEFLKIFNDDWKQIYSNLFNYEQLNMLNTYKGSPLYFN